MINARDVQRTFETWLALAKDEEVLTLAALVHRVLLGRGYVCGVTFSRPGRDVTEKKEDKPSDAGAPR